MSDGEPYNPEYISRNFRRIMTRYGDKKQGIYQELGIPKIRFHVLRHTHASLLLKSETSIKVVAERLGDTVATVMTTYAHVFPDMQKDAAVKLNTLLLNSGNM